MKNQVKVEDLDRNRVAHSILTKLGLKNLVKDKDLDHDWVATQSQPNLVWKKISYIRVAKKSRRKWIEKETINVTTEHNKQNIIERSICIHQKVEKPSLYSEKYTKYSWLVKALVRINHILRNQYSQPNI